MEVPAAAALLVDRAEDVALEGDVLGGRPLRDAHVVELDVDGGRLLREGRSGEGHGEGGGEGKASHGGGATGGVERSIRYGARII